MVSQDGRGFRVPHPSLLRVRVFILLFLFGLVPARTP